MAKPLYEDVVRVLRAGGLTVATGEFRASMRVAVVNDGPVTLLLDSRKVF
jgi:D-tyrosyl-tRNA(Tyr) deacylase